MIETLLDNMDCDPELGAPAGKTSAKIMQNPGWHTTWCQGVEACLRLAEAADRRRAVGCEHEIALANYMCQALQDRDSLRRQAQHGLDRSCIAPWESSMSWWNCRFRTSALMQSHRAAGPSKATGAQSVGMASQDGASIPARGDTPISLRPTAQWHITAESGQCAICRDRGTSIHDIVQQGNHIGGADVGKAPALLAADNFLVQKTLCLAPSAQRGLAITLNELHDDALNKQVVGRSAGYNLSIPFFGGRIALICDLAPPLAREITRFSEADAWIGTDQQLASFSAMPISENPACLAAWPKLKIKTRNVAVRAASPGFKDSIFLTVSFTIIWTPK